MVSSGVRQWPDGARGPLGSCESYRLDLVSVVCCQTLSHKGLRCFCGGGWGGRKENETLVYLLKWSFFMPENYSVHFSVQRHMF